jgi:hypothetical protein
LKGRLSSKEKIRGQNEVQAVEEIKEEHYAPCFLRKY